MAGGAAIESVRVSAFEIPTSTPESDGTLAWDRTVLVTVEIRAGGLCGIGYTYADAATALFIRDHLSTIACAADPMAIPATYRAMQVAVRNLGHQGVAAMAISAVDAACWDLKARLLEVPLVDLLGRLRDEVDAYGSGGFTSYSLGQLEYQLGSWREQGFTRMKMKIGSEASVLERVKVAREAIGPGAALFVDANGAYDRKRALVVADEISSLGVTWFEEPVSSDDLEGLRFVRERAPVTMNIAAGEYGFDPRYFEHMLAAGAVDVMQADASRCGGVTGFLYAAAQCETRGIPLSAHCAPTLHTHVACAAPNMAHVEYFHDHQRIEQMLFDGAAVARASALRPDRSRHGMGFALRRAEAEKFQVFDATEGPTR